MEIRLGALVDHLTEQLSGTGISQETLEVFDDHADAITRLHIHGLLTDAQTSSARKKLVRAIEKEAKKVSNDN